MNTERTSVIALRDENKNLIGIIYKDEVTRHNLFFSCELMDFEELETLAKGIVPQAHEGPHILSEEEMKRLSSGEPIESILQSRK